MTSLGGVTFSFFNKKEASIGIIVSDKSKALNIANTIVSATGVKSFPSNPESINKGENTIIIMIVPEKTGVATSLHALKITCKRGRF